MLVWINGPFGGGKTQTAYELHRRLPGSVVCDPEMVGFGLHRTMPRALRGDFQDLPAWRQGVFEVLDLVLNEHDGTVIAPMTVVNPAYFAETVGRLRETGHHVKHFALLASRETVLERLRERSLIRLGLRGDTFAAANVDRCLDALQDTEFAEHIHTDDIGVTQVADRIAESCGLRLTPNTDSRLRARLRRAGVGIRHIRF
ncbi:AAA family ATPase [Nocardia otitidiscaviarum]|uniref:ATP-binding protein n=1 Tax=Nocardia otitidiscaviarum TaxID=1823 RepID=A0A516NSB8_9NOCA|nr:AAA family ATPase [Nocardia otitidiscaviarum]MBF6179594.1 AAA family ATPase [Nocardia otitidiscaviarum]MCP9621044.1 AAA family ATPase [Nocardia otitidiscaviarum]QDP81805.1 ATP-binding protein [Nocardia otitidiscaviarum]